MSDVLEQRAEIERRIEGQTFCTALARTVAERGGAPAYSDKVGVSEAGGRCRGTRSGSRPSTSRPATSPSGSRRTTRSR